MIFRKELFKMDKEISPSNKYQYRLLGAFYDVYTNFPGDYHLAKRDYASLKERLYFYKKEVLKRNTFPGFSKDTDQLMDLPSNSLDVYMQFIGLPEEVYYSYDEKGYRQQLIDPDKLLDSLHFEEDLTVHYGNLNFTMDDFFSQEGYPQIGAINYLIEHGIYFPNLERVVSNESEEIYYPCFLDESKLPDKFLSQKEDSSKFFMEFVNQPLLYDVKSFEELIRPLDNLSLAKKFDKAFNEIAFGTPTFQYSSVIYGLRHYFQAIIRSLVNDFLIEFYNNHQGVADSILDPRALIEYPVDIGSNFTMIKLNYRGFTKSGDQVYSVENKEGTYALDLKDKDVLLFAYEKIQRYLKKKTLFGIMPEIFLKLLGLPYQAFKVARFFDYENGTAKQFVELFEYIDFEKVLGKTLLPYRKDNGSLFYPVYEYPLSYLYHHYRSNLLYKHFFVTDFNCFMHSSSFPYLLFFDEEEISKKDPLLKSLISGEIEPIRASFEKGEQNANLLAIWNIEDINDTKYYIELHAVDGICPQMKDFFDKLNQGMISYEFYSNFDDKSTSQSGSRFFILGIMMVFAYLFYPQAVKNANKVYNPLSFSKYIKMTYREKFYDPYLPLPYVEKGKNFLAYSATGSERGEVYFDSSDRKAINTLHLIFRTYFLPMMSFPLLFSYRKNETMTDVIFFNSQNDYTVEAYFLGLPKKVIDKLDMSKDILSQLVFKDDIGLDNQKNHQQLIKKDPALLSLYVQKEALNRGFMLPLANMSTGMTLFGIKKDYSEKMKYLLSSTYVKNNLLTKSDYMNLSKNYFSKLLVLNDDAFKKEFLDYITGDQLGKGELNFILACDYGAQLMKALRDDILKDKFGFKNNSYLLYYPYGNYFVSPGSNFFAYSYSDDIEGFFFDIQDLEPLCQAIEATRSLYKDTKNHAEQVKRRTHALGLPQVFIKKMYRLLLSGEPTKDEIMLCFSFKKRPSRLSFDNLPSYRKTFEILPVQDLRFSETTQVKNRALSQGLFIACEDNLFRYDGKIGKLMKDTKAGYEWLKRLTVVMMEKPSGYLKTLLAPTMTGFERQVDLFINEIRRKTNDVILLFHIKEYLLSFFRQDSSFCYHASLLFSQKDQAKDFARYIKGLMRKTHLKTDMEDFYQEDILFYTALFLYYQERSALSTTIRFYEKEAQSNQDLLDESWSILSEKNIFNF